VQVWFYWFAFVFGINVPLLYVKIIKGKNEKVIKWDEVRKIKDERYNLGFSIYDENNHKSYVDFRTSNYTLLKEVMIKMHKDNKHKAN
jgi:hypothetical protein